MFNSIDSLITPDPKFESEREKADQTFPDREKSPSIETTPSRNQEFQFCGSPNSMTFAENQTGVSRKKRFFFFFNLYNFELLNCGHTL